MRQEAWTSPHPMAWLPALALALAATGAWGQAASPAKTTKPAAAPAGAAMEPDQSALGCLIDASAAVEVGAPVIGVVESIAVERGDLIKKGQVLMRFEASVEKAAVALAQTKVNNQADIASARSQKAFAGKKARRTAELTEQKFLSSQARDQADTEASMADMRLEQALEQRALAINELQVAHAQLAQRTITSPITGVVVDRLVSVGERIENRPMFKLAQIDPLRVEVVLPASQFGAIKVGMNAKVLPDIQGTRALKARVAIVDRVIDASSNTFRARLALPNPDHALPSGLRCKVDFGS